MHVIGLMSGTSLDGVDAAAIETDGETVFRTGPALTLAYPPALRARLRVLLDRAPNLAAGDPGLLAAERDLTDVHAEAVAALGVRAELIGFHGQTILHDPARRRTWQIGDAARLAARTGVPVAHDFRSADVAAGGEGAPLAPLYHAARTAHLARPLLVLNVGGVANGTWLGPDGAIVACDTGPGNGPLDDFVASRTGAAFDEGGALALSGTPDQELIAHVLADPFFARPPPKSLDRLAFAARLGGLAGLSDADGAATLAALVAACVAVTAWPGPLRQMVVCGGGRRNAAIMAALRALPCPVLTAQAAGLDGDALEAECFGFLAVRVVRGLPLSLPETTGVRQSLPGGIVSRPPTVNVLAPLKAGEELPG